MKKLRLFCLLIGAIGILLGCASYEATAVAGANSYFWCLLENETFSRSEVERAKRIAQDFMRVHEAYRYLHVRREHITEWEMFRVKGRGRHEVYDYGVWVKVFFDNQEPEVFSIGGVIKLSPGDAIIWKKYISGSGPRSLLLTPLHIIVTRVDPSSYHTPTLTWRRIPKPSERREKREAAALESAR